jgi:poly(hydroxyalkanoate) depolymerase family esterase
MLRGSPAYTRLFRHLTRSSRRNARALREVTERLTNVMLDGYTLPHVTPAPAPAAPAPEALSLAEFTGFGDNPGRLDAQLLPARRPGAPLLVVLHGCTQQAPRFAAASGFLGLAERIGAALLLPEQTEHNNPQRCFNWFFPAEAGREVESLRQMTATAAVRCHSDRGRVYVVGLSAGGAITAALLASAPNLFAAGAVVAGLPVGAARDIPSAFVAMERAPDRDGAAWAAELPPSAIGHLPRLLVWHGTEDRTVDPANGEALVAQWTAALGIPDAPTQDLRPAPRLRRRIWSTNGSALVEHWSMAGLGHAYPVNGGIPTDPFVVAAGVDATDAIARFWGLDVT